MKLYYCFNPTQTKKRMKKENAIASEATWSAPDFRAPTLWKPIMRWRKTASCSTTNPTWRENDFNSPIIKETT